MKKYIAIGHFKGNDNMTSVAMEAVSRKSFEENLRGNEFVAWAVIGERKMNALRANIDDCFGLWDEVKKRKKWITEETATAAAVDRMEETTEGGGFILRVMKRPA